MWLFELVLLSLVIGVPFGIAMRVWDEWQEKRKENTKDLVRSENQKKLLEAVNSAPKEELLTAKKSLEQYLVEQTKSPNE